MNTPKTICQILLGLVAVSSVAFPANAADSPETIFKRNDCGKCHAPEKEKRGASLKKTAEKYAGKGAEAENKLAKAMVAGERVKFTDGTEENHKILDTKDPAEIKNLARWILDR